MKKSVLLVLAAGLVISACNKSQTNSNNSKKEVTSQKTDSIAQKNDSTAQKSGDHRPTKGPVKVSFNTPVINDYGSEHYFPKAAVQPDPGMDYKVVVLIIHNDAKAEHNEGLDHIARLINLLHDGGVKPNHIHIVGVMTGPATAVAMNDSTYKKMYTVINPNDSLMTKLTRVGHVKLYVCAQAVSFMGYGPVYLNSNVKMALSALTTVTTYELKGYALMQF
ncbi:MAG TPA: DsrE family protein [Balneolales bacterium]|jgi:intracellular sulfur oxidation DsrE/DsrF family protein|nr:DsrE family protein [Balneolales bacterium]